MITVHVTPYLQRHVAPETALVKGLQQDQAFDLVYLHAREVAPDENQLAFGFTTGSLWFSADRGDWRQTLSAHLPSIFCMRWA